MSKAPLDSILKDANLARQNLEHLLHYPCSDSDDLELQSGKLLKSYQGWLSYAKEELYDSYELFNKLLKPITRLEEANDSFPEHRNLINGFYRLFFDIRCLFSYHNSGRRLVEKKIKAFAKRKEIYETVKSSVDEGRDYLGFLIKIEAIPERIMADTKECLAALGDIAYFYSRLAESTQKIIDLEKEFRDMLYPPKSS